MKIVLLLFCFSIFSATVYSQAIKLDLSEKDIHNVFIVQKEGLSVRLDSKGQLQNKNVPIIDSKVDKAVKYDFNGRLSEIVGLPIDYDINGRIRQIGKDRIDYDINDRVRQIGNKRIDYDINNRIRQIGEDRVDYDINNRVRQIGDKRIDYDLNNRIRQIGDKRIDYDINGNIREVGDLGDNLLLLYKTIESFNNKNAH